MLKIVEMFHSIQGEGQTIGKNVVFIRLSGCNLKCTFCDSKNSWSGGYEISNKDVYDFYIKSKAQGLVISGGEPTLFQNDLISLLTNFKFNNVEIETNGTITINKTLLDLIKYINVSPKLENSMNSKSSRYNESALKLFSSLNSMSTFKFVITSDKDMCEVDDIIKNCNINNTQVYLMCEGITRDVQLNNQQSVIDICFKKGYNFSPRVHVLIWNTKKEV